MVQIIHRGYSFWVNEADLQEMLDRSRNQPSSFEKPSDCLVADRLLKLALYQGLAREELSEGPEIGTGQIGREIIY